MTDKELKKLSRIELLEMLVDVSKDNETLKSRLIEAEEAHKAEMEAVTARYQEQLDTKQKLLDDRRIAIANTGSIAEACLQINGIFEAAQASAEQYLENVRHTEEICRQMESNARAEASVKIVRADSEAQKLLDDARTQADQLLSDAKEQSEKMITDAQEKTTAYWDSVSKRLSVFYEEYQGLKELLGNCGGNEKR